MRRQPENFDDLLKDELFVKWCRTTDEQLNIYWMRWIEQNPSMREQLLEAKNVVSSLDYKDSFAMKEGDYDAVLDSLIQFNNDTELVNEERAIGNRNRRRVIWFAASIVMALCVTIGVLRKPAKEKIAQPELVQYITKSAAKGTKTTFKLPDGTVVKLNSLSTLKYPSAFSSASREVFLTGQAFFEVTKNEKSPFVVHTENFTTLVLGTSFDIRSYPGEKIQHVAVVTGKVKVATLNGFSETLTPDEMTIYKNHEMIRKSGFNHEAVLGWKDGVLQFNEADFATVTEQLSVWYGVDFIIDSDLRIHGKYTGVYRDESLENVLKGISFSSKFEFIINDKIVRITKPQIR